MRTAVSYCNRCIPARSAPLLLAGHAAKFFMHVGTAAPANQGQEQLISPRVAVGSLAAMRRKL